MKIVVKHLYAQQPPRFHLTGASKRYLLGGVLGRRVVKVVHFGHEQICRIG
ncbi:MAG: hypothetical protein IMHGJWDQ_000982, partial [Candidatus Fervidibacter sp.]